jgi:hypothetical protein
MDAIRRNGARFSRTAAMSASIRTAIAAIGEDAWTPIRTGPDRDGVALDQDLADRGVLQTAAWHGVQLCKQAIVNSSRSSTRHVIAVSHG